MAAKKIVKTFVSLEHATALNAIAEASRISVSGLISHIIAERLEGGDVENFGGSTESISPSEFNVKDVVRYTVALPLSLMSVIDERAKKQGMTRKRYVASLLTSHASCEPIYDRAAQITIQKTLDKVHAMAINLNMLRVTMESRGEIPRNLEAELLTATALCENLLSEVNQMRLANVERWRST
ncbi:conserved hypothetical protein [Thiomonas arsenitoxydans]|nr:hypothetical protein [Thiomonas arsenitoxydans]CQR32661.1 conserved hypothetical protein [Thiomonas arsenitoxydans]CQR45716.1 conserved protein of unknown function [Thiomonas sp. CB3]